MMVRDQLKMSLITLFTCALPLTALILPTFYLTVRKSSEGFLKKTYKYCK